MLGAPCACGLAERYSCSVWRFMRHTYYSEVTGEAINYSPGQGIVRGKAVDDADEGWRPPPKAPRKASRPALRTLQDADRCAIRAVWREYGGYREGQRMVAGMSMAALGPLWGVTEGTVRALVRRRGSYRL